MLTERLGIKTEQDINYKSDAELKRIRIKLLELSWLEIKTFFKS